MSKELLAQALREYPTWGHAYLDVRERFGRMLLDVEGSLLGYWTDIPEAEIKRLTAAIRETLGDFEPTSADEVSGDAS